MYAYHIQKHTKEMLMKVAEPVSVRMPTKLKEILQSIADAGDRSLSKEILRRVKESLKNEGIVIPE
ncbi:Arc family DNA-binding protein [Photorhabdus tasmaniensis]|nr:Arc family DNA-binding protein [Photorhabdus tasmaniensis]